MYAVANLLKICIVPHNRCQMIDHFGDTSYIKADTGYSAGHCFHNHVRKILFQRRDGEEVYGIVDIYYLMLILDVRERVDMERKLLLQLL